MAFREFAESVGERAEPKDAQEEIYVGLEHLELGLPLLPSGE
jgi:hypothetical protein